MLCALLWVFCLSAGVAHAQQPTDAQRSAIKSACRSDFIAQCSGVTPGGKEALTCLQQHSATLSPACRSAVSALDGTKKKSSAATPAETPATAPAQSSAAAAGTPAAQPTQAQRNAVKSACRSDFMAQCSGVTPGGSQALACLQQHSATLSPSCQQAVAALGGASAPAGAAQAPAGGGAAAMPGARAGMPSFSPREELIVLHRTCGPDFRAFCRSVPLGGGRGIACLRNNMQRLSPVCQRVLTSGL
ncbi:hypothetical protein GGD50_001798 [Rhizobium paranaense]|uniref:Uncharacterized protein n=2 Tax=Rhizobium/Agrobacterium group TaxID=227290 RepID=A0A7W8XPH4_9HYPH|nr:hypothetical protein [Rhizobium paranaense]